VDIEVIKKLHTHFYKSEQERT